MRTFNRMITVKIIESTFLSTALLLSMVTLLYQRFHSSGIQSSIISDVMLPAGGCCSRMLQSDLSNDRLICESKESEIRMSTELIQPHTL